MSHFAKLDENNVVIQVLVIEQKEIDSGRWGDPARFVQTSYNNNMRVRFAGVGFTYDPVNNAFIPPQPFPSWTLDPETLDWIAPVSPPDVPADWDEASLSWIRREGVAE